MFFVFVGCRVDVLLMVWGVLAGGGSHVLAGCSSVLGPTVTAFSSSRQMRMRQMREEG